MERLLYPIIKNFEITENHHIIGMVYGDKRFADGSTIRTSRIKSFKIDEDNIIVITQNNTYILKGNGIIA